MSQQDSLCPECGLISWSGHRCAAILEGEEHMNPQPKALVLADALEELDVQFSHTGLCGEAAVELRRLHEVNQDLLKALHEALETEQEPVCWTVADGWVYANDTSQVGTSKEVNWEPLYTAPPKREWVGLTDDEVAQAMYRADAIITGPMQFKFAKEIEAKLKEKNHG